MDADYYQTMFDYYYWARDRLLKAADGLSDDDYAKANGFSNYGDLRAILTHCLSAEANNLGRWTATPPDPVSADELSSIGALVSRWGRQEALMRAFVASLDTGKLDAAYVTQRRDGSEYSRPFWVELTQVLNHGTQHRSEAAEALTAMGRSPGNLDFSVYYGEKHP